MKLTRAQRAHILEELQLLLDNRAGEIWLDTNEYLHVDGDKTENIERFISRALEILEVIPKSEYDRAYVDGHADGFEEACAEHEEEQGRGREFGRHIDPVD